MYDRILICGSRDWDDRRFLLNALVKWADKHGQPSVVIEGCARGADSIAGHSVVPSIWTSTEVLHFPAQWDRYGRSAGPRRNQQMLDEGRPDAVIAFSLDLKTSRGTRDMVTRARRAGLRVWLPVPGSDDPKAR